MQYVVVLSSAVLLFLLEPCIFISEVLLFLKNNNRMIWYKGEGEGGGIMVHVAMFTSGMSAILNLL